MEINKVIHGDVLEVMGGMAGNSIDCIITSPPYWQLRDYEWDGQWGLEPTFQAYLEHLWEFADECFRVLKNDGTCWINLGDTFNGNKEGNTSNKGYVEKTIVSGFRKEKQKGISDKCLLLIPHRFAIGCIDRGWTMRNDIIWAKRNGMPESVTDRFSKKHEYFFLMVKQEKYYFDLDGIRDKQKDISIQRYKYEFTGQEGGNSSNYRGRRKTEGAIMGKNPGSVSDFWDSPTQASSDEHYAAYNDLLIGKPIVAGCPKGGIVLDPFCGTATTGCRSIELGRKFIGIDGSEKYVEIANKNLSPYIQQSQLF